MWVAKPNPKTGQEDVEMYTWDAENMMECPKFDIKEDNTCDVCGACCTEVLYEFRCYKREVGASNFQRKLHPCKAFIDKFCGRNLLGVQSETSQVLEQQHDSEDRRKHISMASLQNVKKRYSHNTFAGQVIKPCAHRAN